MRVTVRVKVGGLLLTTFLILPALTQAGVGLPAVTLTANDPSASEVGLDPGQFTVTRSGGDLTQTLRVTLTVSGTATNSIDYTFIGNTIDILANQTSATGDVVPKGDNRLEGDETVIISLASDASYAISAPNTDTVTIADNAATVTLTANDPTASEVGLASGQFTVTRSGGDLTQTLRVTLTVGGTAINSIDYTFIGNTIDILANQTSATGDVVPKGDNRVEGDETVTLSIATSGDANNEYQIGVPSSDTVTIADNAATVTLTANDPTASEVGLASGQFTVTRSGGDLTQTLRVTLTVGGTAINNIDYTFIGNTIDILANQTSATGDVVPKADADAGEGDETVVLTVSASGDPSNDYAIGVPNSDTVTIADNASTPTPTVTASPTTTPVAPTTTPGAPTSTPSQTVTPSPGAETADHFTAYAVATTKGTAKLIPLGPITLADRFGSSSYNVVKLGALLAPADKNGEGRHDPDTHLLEYRLKGTAKFAKRSDVRIVNQCNDVLLQVTKPVSLLAPAAKSLAGPIAAPNPLDHERDHYLCYAAKPETKLPKRVQVVVSDQFQTRRYDLKKITKLCQPADKSGSPVLLKGPNAGAHVTLAPATIRHPEDFLVCYQVKAASKLITQNGCGPADPNDKGTKIPKQPKHLPRPGVHVATQLGALQVDTKKETELCIPSTRP